MKLVHTIQAAAQPIELLNRPLNGMSSSTHEVVVLLVALAAPVLLFLIWAIFIRKRRQPLTGWRGRQLTSSTDEAQSSAGSSGRRRRRRRRDHRPRNPTLAETGGLPPIRSERQESVETAS